MNKNRKVARFILSSFLIYLSLSIAAFFLNITWQPFQRINLIADIFANKSTDNVIDSMSLDNKSANEPVVGETKRNFNFYHIGHFITNFSADSSTLGLPTFTKKLYEEKSGKKKRKIRIAYFGDSMIEGDLLTQTLRKLLQTEFGGSGVGFVPVTSIVSKLRETVSSNYSGNWQDENFKSPEKHKDLFLSGHTFRSNDGWVEMTDRVATNPTDSIEKSLLCGYLNGTTTINVNGTPRSIQAEKSFNRIVLANDNAKSIKVIVPTEQLPVYGISFETETGVVVDNFSFRGITGVEFAQIDSSFLTTIAKENPYDLIVFQYGVNLMFRPNDTNYDWYKRMIIPVIRKFRNCFPSTDFLLVSTADRAFRYGGEYKSAIGIDSLIKVQATIAYENGCSFYNQFETMGGHNSIVDWAARSPSLANKDYVHPNHRGAEVLANYLFQAIMNDYKKYDNGKLK